MPRSASPTVELPRLRAAVNGHVITPDDPGYDQARTIFYGGFERRPAAIVRPADTAQVAQVVDLARDSGHELAVRAGGHSTAGHSLTEGGIVLDLSELSAIEVDPEAAHRLGRDRPHHRRPTPPRSRARARHRLRRHRLGGRRRHHPGRRGRLPGPQARADHRQPARRRAGHRRRPLLEVDDEHHPDLFWAIRGGGGNFGVATRLQVPAPPPRTGSSAGCSCFRRPPEVIAGLHGRRRGRARGAVGHRQCHARAADAVHPRRRTASWSSWPCSATPATPRPDSGPSRRSATWPSPSPTWSSPMPYPEIFPPERRRRYHPTAVARTMFMDTVDRQMAEHDHGAPAGLGCARCGRPAAGARRGHGTGAGRRHGLRAPPQPDHGQPGRVLRRPRRPRPARGLGRGLRPPPCSRATTGAYVNFLVDEGASASARPIRADLGPAGESSAATTRTTCSG